MLKFVRGPRMYETLKFLPSDAPILIGRNLDCHIQIAQDDSISRYQAYIVYHDNKWILKDGKTSNQSDNFMAGIDRAEEPMSQQNFEDSIQGSNSDMNINI